MNHTGEASISYPLNSSYWSLTKRPIYVGLTTYDVAKNTVHWTRYIITINVSINLSKQITEKEQCGSTDRKEMS